MSKREDPLKNSWAYQEIYQEGVRQAQLDSLQWHRQLLEQVVKLYCPNLIEMAKERGNAVDNPYVLQEIILELARVEMDFRALMEEAARQILSK